MLVSAMSSSSTGAVAAPLGQALGVDQAGVGDAQHVPHGRRQVQRIDSAAASSQAYMWLTDSGSS